MSTEVGTIPVTHVGSLVRPPEVIALMRRLDRAEPVDADEQSAVLSAAVRDVVRRQRDAGVDIVSDGEFGKSSWNSYVHRRLGGLELRRTRGVPGNARPPSTDQQRFSDFYADYFETEQEMERPGGEFAAVGPVTYTGQADIGRDIANLRAAMSAEGIETGFLPVVAPASCFPTLIDEHYGSERAALMGIAEALREEYRAIVDAGLYVQVDDAFIPFMYDVLVPPGDMDSYRAWAQPRIEAINHALEGLPRDRVRYHVCWGSWNGPHTNDIPLRDVLPLVLQVNAGSYLIEHANPRHEHEWRVWGEVELPEGTKLAPGVISHSTNVVEHPQLVAERLERIARLIGVDRLLASTDCGFAQGPYIRRVHPTIQWAKLEALAEGARIAQHSLGVAGVAS